MLISLGDDGGQIIELRTRLEPIDVEESPLNNCNGSAPFQATETRSKTVWQQVDVNLEGEIGLKFLLKVRLGKAYQVKDGEAETRSYEITFKVAPQSFIIWVCFISVERMPLHGQETGQSTLFARWGRSPDRAPTHLKHTLIIYTVIWYDVWLEGEIKFPSRDQGIGYSVKKGIMFELDGGRVEPCP